MQVESELSAKLKKIFYINSYINHLCRKNTIYSLYITGHKRGLFG